MRSIAARSWRIRWKASLSNGLASEPLGSIEMQEVQSAAPYRRAPVSSELIRSGVCWAMELCTLRRPAAAGNAG